MDVGHYFFFLSLFTVDLFRVVSIIAGDNRKCCSKLFRLERPMWRTRRTGRKNTINLAENGADVGQNY